MKLVKQITDLIVDSIEDDQEKKEKINYLISSQDSLYIQICSTILFKGKQKCRSEFIENFLKDNIDLCLFTLVAIQQNEDISKLKLDEIIESLPLLNQQDDPLETLFIQTEPINQDQDEDDGEEIKGQQNDEVHNLIVGKAQQEYQKVYIKYLNSLGNNLQQLRKALLEMPRLMIPNFQNPLFLSDFLTGQLNEGKDIEIQVLSLRAIFILLEKHNLDYSNYYNKLYEMIKPRQKIDGTKPSNVQLVSIFNMPEKSRFLRLLDLSLRSPKLPIKLIAAFLKRLAKIIVSFGEGSSSQDIMYVISFIANMIKRHPRCLRLVHKKIKEEDEVKSYDQDPFNNEQDDPLKSNAINSCLWEIELIMKSHYDEKVRNYCKVFKTDFLRKEAFFKCEEFTTVSSLDIIEQELNEVNNEKEGSTFRKNLLKKYNQGNQDTKVGQKRTSDQIDYYNSELLDGGTIKRFKFAEEFEDIGEICALKD